jgi:hypothetical protein
LIADADEGVEIRLRADIFKVLFNLSWHNKRRPRSLRASTRRESSTMSEFRVGTSVARIRCQHAVMGPHRAATGRALLNQATHTKRSGESSGSASKRYATRGPPLPAL